MGRRDFDSEEFQSDRDEIYNHKGSKKKNSWKNQRHLESRHRKEEKREYNEYDDEEDYRR